METIKLLLAHADRRLTNQVEVAVLDVCYDRAVVRSTQTPRLDEFFHQGSTWDFDLIVVGADKLFKDRLQQAWAPVAEVAKGIQEIRMLRSTPIVALTASPENGEALLEAGADSVLAVPLNLEELKSELRALLDLNELVEAGESNRWYGLGSLLRGFQREKEVG